MNWNARRWHGKDRARDVARAQGWRAANPERARRSRKALRLAAYGLTLERFEQMMRDQGGRCLICEEVVAELVVDHCHETKVVRGLLCHSCNLGLGKFADDPDRLRRASTYLEGARRHSKKRAA